MKTFISFLIIAASLYAHAQPSETLNKLRRDYRSDLRKTSDSSRQYNLKRMLAVTEHFQGSNGYPIFKEYVPNAAVVFKKLNQKEKKAFVTEMENCLFTAVYDSLNYDEGTVVEHAGETQIYIINKYAKKVL